MNYIADLHIHSRFSMATSRALNIAHLSAWASRKGIQILGTGDFTHPKWREELARDLVLDEESGFYRSKVTEEKLSKARNPVEPFFCLQTEISSIYKKNGKTRKVHNLVFVPNLETAERLSRRLALIGNINSDGRPILGLDSHDLLEIVLESSPRSFLIPAHIWTPWFSLFGSRSGFDTIEECYEDLTPHIFALETGLSSDPAMNRHLSALDGYALISNSDAHSGPNLGREANLFSGVISYDAMFEALRQASKRQHHADAPCTYLGTCEFYPEEGKYHLDGHRACNVVLEPGESVRLGNICPECGKPLTIGVLHRVMELADRLEPAALPNEPDTRMLVPLAEVISQILGHKPASRKVQDRYETVLAELGSEMSILCQLPEEDVRKYWEPLGEAISRLRSGKVDVNSGFDGQYGVVNIFTDAERKELASGRVHALPGMVQERPVSRIAHARTKVTMEHLERDRREEHAIQLSDSQRRAVEAFSAPVFVIAGPGAGKTGCLINRILKLSETTAPERILAITYTRRAAEEMRERLAPHFAKNERQPVCETLHALAWKILKDKYSFRLLSEPEAYKLFRQANEDVEVKDAEAAWKAIALARERCLELPDGLSAMAKKYQQMKEAAKSKQLVDFCDLLEQLAKEDLRGVWQHVLVDEMQDLSLLQLKLIAKLLPCDGKGFFGIGDPDQAIYSFRGAIDNILPALRGFWPGLDLYSLKESWRSSQTILDMGRSALGDSTHSPPLSAMRAHKAELEIIEAGDEKAEAHAIARKISRLLGSTAHTLLDHSRGEAELAPSDIAILVRLKNQATPLARALSEHGIPFSAPAQEEFWQDESCLEFIQYVKSSESDASPEQIVRESQFADLAGDKNFAALLKFWRRSASWTKFFEELAWLKEAEMISSRAETVRILTMHASKGLEFNTVFLPGLEKGLMPLQRANPENANILEVANPAEEKRLLYVALTRASHRLILSHARSRHMYGARCVQHASPFLASLEKFCVKKNFSGHARQTTQKLTLF